MRPARRLGVVSSGEQPSGHHNSTAPAAAATDAIASSVPDSQAASGSKAESASSADSSSDIEASSGASADSAAEATSGDESGTDTTTLPVNAVPPGMRRAQRIGEASGSGPPSHRDVAGAAQHADVGSQSEADSSDSDARTDCATARFSEPEAGSSFEDAAPVGMRRAQRIGAASGSDLAALWNSAAAAHALSGTDADAKAASWSDAGSSSDTGASSDANDSPAFSSSGGRALAGMRHARRIGEASSSKQPMHVIADHTTHAHSSPDESGADRGCDTDASSDECDSESLRVAWEAAPEGMRRALRISEASSSEQPVGWLQEGSGQEDEDDRSSDGRGEKNKSGGSSDKRQAPAVKPSIRDAHLDAQGDVERDFEHNKRVPGALRPAASCAAWKLGWKDV